MKRKKKPSVLCILDGFGIAPDSPNNAILQANIPYIKHLFETYPWITAHADGEFAGMENGNVGNSEVGHMNLGGLKLVSQLSWDITQSSTDNFEKKEQFDTQNQTLVEALTGKSKHVHVIGLISMGRIHSDIRHIIAAINTLMVNGMTPYLHIITDGRDSDPYTSQDVIRTLELQFPQVKMASVSGRFYAMDRDKNLDRTQLYLDALLKEDLQVKDIYSYIELEYKHDHNDETIVPANLGKTISPGETILLMNYRTDRFKQLATGLIEWNIEHDRQSTIIGLNDYGLDQYSSTEKDPNGHYTTLFQPNTPTTWASKFIEEQGATQLHISETEKYNHVTYFFNGGQNIQQEHEDWHILPSYKVQSHAEKPEMRAKDITDYIIEHASSYDYIVVNYANPDMLGHTGDLEATKKTMEVLDTELKRLIEHILLLDGNVVITADHGNAEVVGEVHDHGKVYFDTAHNANPVPVLMIGNDPLSKLSEQLAPLSKKLSQPIGQSDILDALPGSFVNGYKNEPTTSLWEIGVIWVALGLSHEQGHN